MLVPTVLDEPNRLVVVGRCLEALVGVPCDGDIQRQIGVGVEDPLDGRHDTSEQRGDVLTERSRHDRRERVGIFFGTRLFGHRREG